MTVHTITAGHAIRVDAPSAFALERVMGMAQAMIAGLAADGVTTDEDELALVLRDAGADVEGMLVRLLRAADEAEAHIEALAARVATLAERRARISRKRETCRATVQAIIEALPQVFPGGRYKGAEYSASVRAGAPRPIVTDESALPPACMRVSQAPDMTAIRLHLAANGAVPGVTLSNASPTLTVRSR